MYFDVYKVGKVMYYCTNIEINQPNNKPLNTYDF